MTESASRSPVSDPRFSALVREGETIVGKYVVGRMLGSGGMGMVFAARDERLNRQVAIKVLLPRLVSSQTATQRFLREARASTRITSEHVVKLLEIDTLPDGTPVLVMEYLEGRDLRAVLREDGPLPVRLAVDYLLQALQAIAEGHMQNIVHRDLKPGNLFLSLRADATPLIKVLDFGIAKTLDPEPADTFALTSSEDVRLGSPAYMPPEQLQNPRDVDMRSDIWAIGVTLYELVAGSPPFQGQTYAELLSLILSAPPEALKSRIRDRELPEGLSDVIEKCLQKKREDRYANAAELATSLAPYGSEDARLSMHRVMGMSRVPVSPRTSSGSTPVVGIPPETCDTTLPAPGDPQLDSLGASESGPRRVASEHGSRKRAVIQWTSIALALFFGVMWWRQPRNSEYHVAPSSLSPVEPAPSPSYTKTAPSAQPAPSSLPDLAEIADSSPTLQSVPAKPTSKPPPISMSSPAKKTKAPAALASEAPASAESAHTSEPSRSPLIESLIQQRH
ncbi:MAG TPA: protein kinase [Polyangiaceae bacterium]|nr:protein kinase [Polyangiaceae bacterium]